MMGFNSTKGFEYLPKTADVRFRAFGRDFKELIKNSLLALINAMVDSNKIKKKLKREVKIEAKTLDKLLIKFLEEILFLFDSENFIACDLKETKIDFKDEKYILKAIVLGDNKIKDYDFSLIVKAVTYNEFIFKKEDNGYVAEITLDV